jgi:hypothetical protein
MLLQRATVTKIRQVSSAKVTGSGKIMTEGDGWAEAGEGTSRSRVSSMTKIKEKDGETTVTSRTSGISTSSPGGTSVSGASSGTGLYGNGVAAATDGFVSSSGGTKTTMKATAEAYTSK